MNLFKKIERVEVDNYNLLTQMMELSRMNYSIHKPFAYADFTRLLYSTMCSFDTGRQTGKTEAALRYLDKNRKNTILFAHNAQAKGDLLRRDGCANRRIYAPVDFRNFHDTLRGIRFEKISIIFDECDRDQILDCIDALCKYNILTLDNVSGIVKIGSR